MPTPGVNYNIDLPGNPVGGGLVGSLIGAGLGAAGGGLYGYYTAPEEVDPETGQTKSKWSNVWPNMGIGALGGGAVGGAVGMHGSLSENSRVMDFMNKHNPLEAAKYRHFYQPENIPKKLYGPSGLEDAGKGR